MEVKIDTSNEAFEHEIENKKEVSKAEFEQLPWFTIIAKNDNNKINKHKLPIGSIQPSSNLIG